MSYLAEPTSKTEYGVVKVGDFILVTSGVISLEQDLGPNANVNFNSGNFTDLTVNGDPVITEITPEAGDGINISNLISTGYSASFTVTNTGVLNLNAGPGIELTANTGNITISSFGADLINVIGVTNNYTATVSDEYIGVNSSVAVTITLPLGVTGRVYYIKDELGQGSGKITIQPSGTEKIDDKANYVISVPYQSVAVVFRAGQWRII
jgi:hypothetical protein